MKIPVVRCHYRARMEIKPAPFGDNLNTWFKTLGKQWRPLLISSLAIFVPIGVLVTIAFMATGAGEGIFDLNEQSTDELTDLPEIFDQLTPFLIGAGIWIALQALGAFFVYLASNRIVAAHFAEVEVTWREAIRFAGQRLWPTFLAGVIVVAASLVVVGAVSAFAVFLVAGDNPGFFTVFILAVMVLTTIVAVISIGVSISLFSQVIAMEDTDAVEALRRSFTLVRGRWWATFGFFVVTSLIASAAAQVAAIVTVPAMMAAVVAPNLLGVAYGLITIVQAPLLAAVAAAYSVWYVDLRARERPLMSEQLL